MVVDKNCKSEYNVSRQNLERAEGLDGNLFINSKGKTGS